MSSPSCVNKLHNLFICPDSVFLWVVLALFGHDFVKISARVMILGVDFHGIGLALAAFSLEIFG